MAENPQEVVQLPQDVVGVIMEFFTPSLGELHGGPAKVSKKWHSAFLDHQPLWRYFCRQRWPKTLRRDLTMEVYKKRRTVEIDCAPIHETATFGFTEIENCGFEFAFKCPMVAEMLRDTGEGPSPEKPILHCDACDKHVYTCTTTDELEENVAQERCVRFSRKLLERNAVGEPHVECLVPYKNEEQRQQVQTFLRTAATHQFVQVTSPTFDPMHILHAGRGGGGCSLSLRSVPIGELKNLEKNIVVLAGFFTDGELPSQEKLGPFAQILRQAEGTTLEAFYSMLIKELVPANPFDDIVMGMMVRPTDDICFPSDYELPPEPLPLIPLPADDELGAQKEETPAPNTEEKKKTDAAPVAGGDADGPIAVAPPDGRVEYDEFYPILKNWKSKTSLGLFSSREPELTALDRLFDQIQPNSTTTTLTPAARQAELQKARPLLEEWKTAMEKKTANSKWVDHPRNKAGYFTKLDELLPKV